MLYFKYVSLHWYFESIQDKRKIAKLLWMLFFYPVITAAKTPFHRNHFRASQFVITHTHTYTVCHPGYYLVVDCSDHILCKIGVGEKATVKLETLSLSLPVCVMWLMLGNRCLLLLVNWKPSVAGWESTMGRGAKVAVWGAEHWHGDK